MPYSEDQRNLTIKDLKLIVDRYNSSVFLDVGAQEYQAIITGDTLQELVKRVVVRGITIGNNSEFTRLSAQDCMDVYDRPFVFGGGDVFIIADENSTGFAEATKVWSGVEESRLIQLGKSMQWKTQDLSINASYTDTDEYVEVQSCYAKLRPETCKVRFSRILVLVIIICNACKALCMLRVAWGFADSPPLVTLGDAIASFLDNSDQTTNGLCLASKEDMQNGAWTEYPGPQRWIAKAETYSSVVSIKVWAIINVIFLLACATFLLISVVTAAASSGTVLGTGIGFSVSSKMAPSILPPVITNPGLWGTFLHILLVNTPQSLTSCLNLFYNNLFTNMLIGAEWNAASYTSKRRAEKQTLPQHAIQLWNTGHVPFWNVTLANIRKLLPGPQHRFAERQDSGRAFNIFHGLFYTGLCSRIHMLLYYDNSP
ncbi:uncharacterized protein RSE6_12773 [Rhynchosporium secalis]|uniref:Uncharacterized protein n=1 Tax=Rhynchosporium secalis TaxID=38038 RepID=A0A1E1MRB0_RHYSE|nr:uncharacterized protein RSE6_12773 [Rhynchosporium secalis]